MKGQMASIPLRDQIALAAIPAFPHLMLINQPQAVSAAIYRLADAVLAERSKLKE